MDVNMNKEKQKQLITEIMNEDAKDGLYKKQTAVEWLRECLNLHLTHEQKMQFEGLFQQAKEMEKQQIKECWDVAHQAGRFEGKGIAEENWQTFEQYYNEEYGEQ